MQLATPNANFWRYRYYKWWQTVSYKANVLMTLALRNLYHDHNHTRFKILQIQIHKRERPSTKIAPQYLKKMLCNSDFRTNATKNILAE